MKTIALGLTVLAMSTITCYSQSSQQKCPPGLIYAGTIYGAGSYMANFYGRGEVLLPSNVRLDSSYRQDSINPANGKSDARSSLTAGEVPAGIFLYPHGADDHEKGWSVVSPVLSAIAWDSEQRITRFAVSAQLYCTTGSSVLDATVGGCNVGVDVCYKEKH
jgi:hypothetical protein